MIIGQIPPPYHGSNIMAEITKQALSKLGYTVCFIDKKLSTEISQIGKLTIRKIFRIPVLAIEILIKSLKEKISLCVYFIAVGKTAFLLDSFWLFILRKCKIPYVIRFDGKGYSLLKKEGHFWNKIITITLSQATGGIVLGNKLKNDVISFIENTRLIKVPNCIPEPIIYANHSRDGMIRVLFLSNLIPSKGVMEVLRAAKIVLKQKEVLFTLAGSSSSKEFTRSIYRFIKKNKIEKYINLPGFVTGKSKAQLFELSDIFVFPTYYKNETFGLVNIEAMSYGIPVITSDEGGISEIIQNGLNGFIVNPKSPIEIAEKILLLAQNESLRKFLGDNGRKLYQKKYTPKAHAEALDYAIDKFIKFSTKDKLINIG